MKAQRRLKNMKIVRRADGFPRPRFGKQILVSLLSLALLFATWPQNLRQSWSTGRYMARPKCPTDNVNSVSLISIYRRP